MMIKFIFCLILLITQTTVYSQHKNKVLPPPPPPKKVVENNPVLEILKKQKSTDAFVWQIDADTILLPKSVYKETIEEFGGKDFFDELSDNAIIRRSLTVDTVKLKKEEIEKKDIDSSIGSSYFELLTYKITVKKDIVIFENNETKIKEKFKVFLDKKKTKILYLQSLSSKKIYRPGEFEGATPMGL